MSRSYWPLKVGFSTFDPKKTFFKGMRQVSTRKKLHFLTAYFSTKSFYFWSSICSTMIVLKIKTNQVDSKHFKTYQFEIHSSRAFDWYIKLCSYVKIKFWPFMPPSATRWRLSRILTSKSSFLGSISPKTDKRIDVFLF